MEELVQARRLLVAADKRAGDSRSTIRDERHLDDAIQRLSLLQWLGDGEWTGHNQVEGPPTLSGPVESYASPEHRRQQAQARRAAAARVAAQREDSSDLASEPVWKSNVAAHLRPRPNHGLHAIDATPARWRGDVGSSPLDGASTAASSSRNDLVKKNRAHPTYWLISTQGGTG